ncbi:hypothetical protein MRX96_022918 [Rhipicephalus microplus]
MANVPEYGTRHPYAGPSGQPTEGTPTADTCTPASEVWRSSGRAERRCSPAIVPQDSTASSKEAQHLSLHSIFFFLYDSILSFFHSGGAARALARACSVEPWALPLFLVQTPRSRLHEDPLSTQGLVGRSAAHAPGCFIGVQSAHTRLLLCHRFSAVPFLPALRSRLVQFREGYAISARRASRRGSGPALPNHRSREKRLAT